MKRFCMALDLKNDPSLIAAYEAYHEKIWPEIEASVKLNVIWRINCTFEKFYSNDNTLYYQTN